MRSSAMAALTVALLLVIEPTESFHYIISPSLHLHNGHSHHGHCHNGVSHHGPSGHPPSTLHAIPPEKPSTPLALLQSPHSNIYQQALLRTSLWVSLATLFGLSLSLFVSPSTSQEFFAGYLLEQSLSLDNLFVFLLLFDYFRVPLELQQRVLKWGIAGAVIMRASMIGMGAVALHQFRGVLLIFAAILVYTSFQTLTATGEDEGTDPNMTDNAIVNFTRNLLPSVNHFEGDKFFTVVEGVTKATPLFVCLVAVEISDVVFAVDSIPAVFGVTENPLVVFSSNMFAIMGLRSLYIILSQAATDLKYLEPAVGIVLGFIGLKIIGEYFGLEIPTELALGVVALFLSGGVALSLVEKREMEMKENEVEKEEEEVEVML